MLFDYNIEEKESILKYAKKLEGLTFSDIIDLYNLSLYKSYEDFKNNIVDNQQFDISYFATSAKGKLGNFLEKYYFGYEPNSKQSADFEKAGLELKLTPIDIKKDGSYRAGERLVITMISYENQVIEDFYKSHVWEKIKSILLIHYIRNKQITDLEYIIKFVNEFVPSEEDIKIIIDDYNKINAKIKAGKADELSEGDTNYLGACTKGSTAEKSFVKQYYSDRKAKKRSFCLKQSYMNYLLKYKFQKNVDDSEEIIRDSKELENTSFEQLILDKISKYKNYSDDELANLFNVNKNDKAFWARIVYRIIGIKGNSAREFVKANIKVKSIRVEESGSIREHMPLPAFKFKDVANQKFEESDLYEILTQTKYLYVIYRKNGNNYYLENAKFWNMKNSDIEIVKNEYQAVKNIINDGVKLIVNTKKEVSNNFPKPKNTQIIHVRPHTRNSAYRLFNGFAKGSLVDADELPNGEYMTKQSFWINKDYLVKELNLDKDSVDVNFLSK